LSLSRNPADGDSNDEVNNDDGSRVVIRSPRSQQENNPQNSSYGRFLSWGFEGVSYLGGQVKQRVERSLLWVSPEPGELIMLDPPTVLLLTILTNDVGVYQFVCFPYLPLAT
jgi:hypothetical protein